MKKNILLSLIIALFSTAIFSQVTISPASFNVTDQITITVSFASALCNGMGAAPAKVYMHAGIGNDTNAFGYSVVGNWGVDDSVGLMTNNGNGTWSITLTPSTYFTGFDATEQANATKLGMVFRNATGTQTLKKPTTCSDFIFNVGLFQTTLATPPVNSTTIINSGGSRSVQASNTNGVASYNLKANGVSINSVPSATSYSYTHTGITQNTNYDLEIVQGASTQVKKFYVIVDPGVISEALPSGTLEDGINYNTSDATRATLVLTAPGKDFVYVAGSFNNWQPDINYAMKKDPTSGKFWLEISGLTPNVDYTYQYWVVDNTPIANSPKLVKTADPFSTLVLSPFDDPGIPAISYPNLPAYPAGQEREVTVLKTGQTPYNWQVTNFTKPKKEDLVVYEVLVRDFDSHRNFQDLIDRIDYFKNLKINAIELMPVMEYEGNESWGYNTSFHLALDKFYGPGSKLKEFIDLCHQNGIAVILDVALNHAFGRNPMDRMWMSDPDGDGWGGPASDNPYFNVIATHSYGVGNDFNHSSEYTRYYVRRVIKQWIQEFKIDGFRWDLTKGFTQNATGSDALTNQYQQDRVDVLRSYADYSWSLDPYHYAIFEHLGAANEEQQWANYRINGETDGISKGVMMWGESYTAYKDLARGAGTSIAGIGADSRGFAAKRLIGYPESHDKDRIMYEAKTFGVAGTTSPLNNLNNALGRMSAIGATSILVPGPKMIWHFAELGMDDSIWTCNNGIVNSDYDGGTPAGDCKLDTKPQPQWTNNWLNVPLRAQIYNDWTRFIDLKKTQPVFEGSYSFSPDGNNLKQRIYIFDTSLPTSEIRNVVILANFSTESQNINPNFYTTGTWINLMDNSPYLVSNATAPITIPAGQFRVFGDHPANLNNDTFELSDSVLLYPNPSNDYFSVNTNTTKVQVYSISGQLVKSFDQQPDGFQFNIADLKTGIYMVKITDSNNRLKTTRLVKQ
ncbi:alpha-amylase family glycosyl hydrolase [Flavobacterium sp.]|uniref:alpha-amylase family glycosyl hydrolase n=1 Tax=Flavobacterium sp. TaxID=239 RepID=UPI0026239DB7|nr:alpha-amylase family glycosyl hydrolase [Flavobacterium sp.]